MPHPAPSPRPAGDTGAGIPLGNYVVHQTLGQGTFGKVKAGVHVTTGERVAIKILEVRHGGAVVPPLP